MSSSEMYQIIQELNQIRYCSRPRAENCKSHFQRPKRRNLAEKRLRSTAKLLSLALWTVSEGVALVSCENMQAGLDVKRRSIQMLDRRSIQQLNLMLKTRAIESDVEDKSS
ncbi:putative serine/threonine-protein kinase abkC [Dorcoceras hygrometricum]|uniref:Putative serine/threonine-protein kinase abkC n=1 Tax=Dorcoceras hygrometricum TaxID=472368 RepID=A0A2Z7CLX3_9LAMI|nr:putative serine/threonine-protein kinase abkC [Dorcoceras hygrometricum]